MNRRVPGKANPSKGGDAHIKQKQIGGDMGSTKTKKTLGMIGIAAIAFLVASVACLERGFANDNVIFLLTKRFVNSITPSQHPFWDARFVGRTGTRSVCRGSATAFLVSHIAIVPVSVDKEFSVCEIQPDTPYHNCVESFAAGQRDFMNDWELVLTVNGESESVMTLKNHPFEYSQNPNTGGTATTCANAFPPFIVKEPQDSCVANIYMDDLSMLPTGSYTLVSDLHDAVTGEQLNCGGAPCQAVINVVDTGVDSFGRTCH